MDEDTGVFSSLFFLFYSLSSFLRFLLPLYFCVLNLTVYLSCADDPEFWDFMLATQDVKQVLRNSPNKPPIQGNSTDGHVVKRAQVIDNKKLSTESLPKRLKK